MVLGSNHRSMYDNHSLKILESNVFLLRRYNCWRGGYKTKVLGRGTVAMATNYVIFSVKPFLLLHLIT